MKYFLSDEDRKNLQIQHKAERNRRATDHIKALLLADNGLTYREIAKVLLLEELWGYFKCSQI